MNTSAFHCERFPNAKAWTANTVGPSSAWYYALPPQCRSFLESLVTGVSQHPWAITTYRLEDYFGFEYPDHLRPVVDELETGRGFVIFEAPPPGRYSRQEMVLHYWLVGQLLGQPIPQNLNGVLLYDVREVGAGKPYESGFHTDNPFGREVLDYLGLLCLCPAKSGGSNQLINGYAIVNDLRTHHPDVLETLCQPFHIDRRGNAPPGEAPTIQHPIIECDRHGLLLRYLHDWIEVGHKKAGQSLTSAQAKALDVLDDILHRRDMVIEFGLQAGEMLFVNNRWLLHNRTAFEDHADSDLKRHLVRLWLQSRR